MSDKVVYLSFSNEKLSPKGPEVLACTFCQNKTYMLVCTADFPMVQCCVCGAHIGKVGWTDTEAAP